jgi:hypothetical protein
MPDSIGQMMPFRWHDDEAGNYGEGISRPRHGKKTREFKLIVYPQGAQPMTWITRAESKRDAIKYAQNRWPNAEVEAA